MGGMGDSIIGYTQQHGVAVIALQRERHMNALSMALRDAIEKVLQQAAHDENVQILLLHGGRHCFSAGYDLREAVATNGAALAHRMEAFATALIEFPKIIVAAVTGPALAGGFDLALSVDIVLAGKKALFGRPEAKFGSPLPEALLTRKIGRQSVAAWADGKPRNRALATKLGFVSYELATGDPIAEAIAYAERLASMPPATLAAYKEIFRRALGPDIASEVRRESARFATLATEPDFVAKIRAYAEAKGLLL